MFPVLVIAPNAPMVICWDFIWWFALHKRSNVKFNFITRKQVATHFMYYIGMRDYLLTGPH